VSWHRGVAVDFVPGVNGDQCLLISPVGCRCGLQMTDSAGHLCRAGRPSSGHHRPS